MMGDNQKEIHIAQQVKRISLVQQRKIHWRASLVPAAAVIPAPIAYIKVAAVKKLVVGQGMQTACKNWKRQRNSVFPRAPERT